MSNTLLNVVPSVIFDPATAPKRRAKRQREFLVEVRELPSGLGEMIGKKPTGWLLAFPFSKLELARRAIIKEGTRTPTFFTRGYEFRIRRTDRKL